MKFRGRVLHFKFETALLLYNLRLAAICETFCGRDWLSCYGFFLTLLNFSFAIPNSLCGDKW